MATAFFSHSRFRDHDNGAGHPERAARLDAVDAALHRDNLWDALLHPDFAAAEDKCLLVCHTPRLVEQVRHLAQVGGGSIDSDTHVTTSSFDVAKLAVGAALRAVDMTLGAECDNAFVAARPPGHHAESDRAMGFCLFNTVACAARYAQRQHGLERIAILDWDVHHGNGTQEIFYEDSSVLFASVHQWPFYPGTGRREERGRGEGMGYTLNFPLPTGSGDPEYMAVWEKIGEAVDIFAPQMILVSAGFDAHRRDPLGGMNVSADGFAHLARTTRNWAQQHCDGRLVCVLEGGYSLGGLSDSVAATIKVLLRQ